MVVKYATASEGSCMSFFTITPQILCKCRGSILPKVFPQVALAVGCAVLARFWNPVAEHAPDALPGMGTVGILLSLLLVFKTQSSYNQFWSAMSHLESILQLSRSLAMATCTLLPWEDEAGGSRRDGPRTALQERKPVRFFARKVLRMLVLHYFLLIEFFRKSGINAATNPAVSDQLRQDICSLTGPNEFMMLYEETQDTPGSKSSKRYGNPMLVIYWIQLAICRCADIHQMAPPKYGIFISQISELTYHFWEMNKIDKTQFPLPYAQVAKLVCLLFVYILPFVLQPKTKELTEFIVVIVAIGFFGLDEVAEILEAPFGSNPNHIDLKRYGRALSNDLEMIFHTRDKQLDAVFDDDNELSFHDIRHHESQGQETPMGSTVPAMFEKTRDLRVGERHISSVSDSANLFPSVSEYVQFNRTDVKTFSSTATYPEDAAVSRPGSRGSKGFVDANDEHFLIPPGLSRRGSKEGKLQGGEFDSFRRLSEGSDLRHERESTRTDSAGSDQELVRARLSSRASDLEAVCEMTPMDTGESPTAAPEAVHQGLEG